MPYFTICHSASFSSQSSITMKKKTLFKEENIQSTKRVSYTMKKNKLFKEENNQSTKEMCALEVCVSEFLIRNFLKSSEGVYSITTKSNWVFSRSNNVTCSLSYYNFIITCPLDCLDVFFIFWTQIISESFPFVFEIQIMYIMVVVFVESTRYIID